MANRKPVIEMTDAELKAAFEEGMWYDSVEGFNAEQRAYHIDVEREIKRREDGERELNDHMFEMSLLRG